MTDIRGDKYSLARLEKSLGYGYAQIKFRIRRSKIYQKIVRSLTLSQSVFQLHAHKQLWPYNWKKQYRRNLLNEKVQAHLSLEESGPRRFRPPVNFN